jgi:hypothetical protein
MMDIRESVQELINLATRKGELDGRCLYGGPPMMCDEHIEVMEKVIKLREEIVAYVTTISPTLTHIGHPVSEATGDPNEPTDR